MDYYDVDLTDPDAVTPIEIALNPALADAFENIAAPGWPDKLPGIPA